MQYAPTDKPDRPTEQITDRDCAECGTTIYVPAPSSSAPGPALTQAVECKECWTDGVADRLDADRDAAYGRVRSISDLLQADALPVADPAKDGNLLIDVELATAPRGSRYVRAATWIIEADCPECGHDRADLTEWSYFTAEHGENTVCRACEHIIVEHSSL